MGETFRFHDRAHCPACGAPGGRVRFDEPFGEGATWAFLDRYYEGRITREQLGQAHYTIVACSGCGAHYQRYALDDAGMMYLYEVAISPDASLAKRENAEPSYFRTLVRDARRVADLIPAARARDVRVLDFGMGWGHWAAAAKALGHTVAGAELSPRRIAFAASLGVPTADLEALQPASLDYVHADQVFEHLREPRSLLAVLARLLRPGGVIRIAVPNGSRTAKKKPNAGWAAAKDELHPLEHLTAYTASALDRMAQEAGLVRITPDLKTRLKRRLRSRPEHCEGSYRKPA